MAVHPKQHTTTLPCKGLDTDDVNKVLKWGTTTSGENTNQGFLVLATDNSEIAGLSVVVEKADTGAKPKLCTLEYGGVLRLPVADSVSLSAADKNKPVLGGAKGTAKPADPPAALDPSSDGSPTDAEILAYHKSLLLYLKTAKGRIIDFSNETGNKWVDVVGFFG